MYDPLFPLPETTINDVEVSASNYGSNVGAIKTPVGRFKADSAAECATRCQKYPNCLAAVHDAAAGTCVLLNDVAGRATNKAGVTSTIRRYTQIKFHPPSQDTVISGGTVLYKVNVSTLAECEALASASDNCSAYNYVTATGECTLLGGPLTAYTTAPANGVQSSRRVDW